MRIKRIFLQIAVLIAVIGLSGCSACYSTEPQVVTTQESSQFETEKEKYFSQEEMEDILHSMENRDPNLEILDYAFGTKDSLVSAVSICKEITTGAEKTILFMLKGRSVQIMDLAVDVTYLKYCENDGIRITPADSILFALRDESENVVLDYEIVFSIPFEGSLRFDVFSEERLSVNSQSSPESQVDVIEWE